MALAVRLHQLNVVSDWSYRLMCQELSKRGFRRGEPGSTLVAESSSLWAQVLNDLRREGFSFPYLANLIAVRAADVKSLLVGLVPIGISGGATQSSRRAGALRLVADERAEVRQRGLNSQRPPRRRRRLRSRSPGRRIHLVIAENDKSIRYCPRGGG